MFRRSYLASSLRVTPPGITWGGRKPGKSIAWCHGTVTLAGLLLGALIGFILAPVLPPIPDARAATAPVGKTEGKFEITQRGSAKYEIPIVVPPGTRGIAPKLTLTYDSQGGNGFVGHGWSLGGLSVIHRCGATWYHDNFRGGVNYDDDDRFCLDGERLIHIGGGEYHTWHETWQKVLAYDSSGQLTTSSNPYYFDVWGKDGQILQYGGTNSSRIEAQGRSDGMVRLWAMNLMSDRLGNTMTVSYVEDGTNGDYRPDKIEYTSNPAHGVLAPNTVYFDYEDRTDWWPMRYEGGSRFYVKKRLTNIRSYTTTGSNAVLVRNYKLNYDYGGAAGRSRLTSVQECGTDGICLPATTFSWQNGSVGFGTAQNQYWSTNKTADAPIGFADISGDGRQDFWGRSGNGNVYVRLLQQDGTFGSAYSVPWGTATTGFTDINGDSKADFWGWSGSTLTIRLSNGDGTFQNAVNTGSVTSEPGFADIDGDGLADVFNWASDNNVYVRLGNGNGTFDNATPTLFSGSRTFSPIVRFADVNGDGRADLIGERDSALESVTPYTCNSQGGSAFTVDGHWTRSAVIRYSVGNGTFGPELSGPAWYVYAQGSTANLLCVNPHAPIGDINADGNADIVLYWFTCPCLPGGPTGVSPPFFGLADVNGDGMDDYYSWYLSLDETVTVQISYGGFWPSGNIGIAWSANPNDSPIGFTDINGDGMADFWGWHSDGNIKIKYANPTKPDLLTSITNGLGEKIAVSYRPLTDPAVHVPSTGGAYPFRPLTDTTYVVRTADRSDGLGGGAMNRTTYTYGGQVYHHTAAQKVGFAWIRRQEPDGSTVDDYYNQGIEGHGTLKESFTYVNGVTVKHLTNDWRVAQWADANGRVVIVAPRLWGRTEESYDLNRALISNVTTYTEYDDYGYPWRTTVTRADGRKTTTVKTYDHDVSNWLLGLETREEVTAEAPGVALQKRVTEKTWIKPYGLLGSETVEPDVGKEQYMRKKRYEYDDIFGNLKVVETSGTGITTRTTTQQFDPSGRFPVSRTNALGHVETLEFDARNGQPTKQTGPNQLDTIWSYDGFGRKQTETRPDGTGTATTYATCDTSCTAPAVMRVSTATTGKGTTWTYTDTLGREVKTVSQGFQGAWVYVTTAYDRLGRVISKSHPFYSGNAPHYVTIEYDALGRPWRVTTPKAATTTAYNGVMTTVTNPLSQATVAVKDSEGHVVDTTDALQGHWRSSFDAFGNELTRTDPTGNTITMTYDLRGRRKTLDHPDLGLRQFDYNVLDELIWQKDARQKVTTYTYDVLGRMETRTRPEGVTTRTYDTAAQGIGKLASVSSPGGYQETHSYDGLGRESSVTRTIGGTAYTMGRTYDVASQLDTLTYPTDFAVRHVYDGFGNLTALRNAETDTLLWQATSQDAHGRLKREDVGNGKYQTWSYNATNDDLTAIGGVQQVWYGFDAGGNLKNMTPAAGGFYTESYYYDDLNRLVSVEGPAPKTIDYDESGNITAKSDVGTYAYETAGPHAVTSTSGAVNAAYQYDANGNIAWGGGGFAWYTSFDKPATISRNGKSTSFKYGADDARIEKKQGTTTTRYVGRQFEQRIAGAIQDDRHFLYAGNRAVGVAITLTAYGYPLNYVSYYHTDYLGSVTAVSDQVGKVTNLSYDAWGKRRNSNGTDAATPPNTSRRGFTGQEHDDELALINMQAREQDPALGRFLSPDPLADKGDPNPYAYANNNPLKYVDLSGTSYHNPSGWNYNVDTDPFGLGYNYYSDPFGLTRAANIASMTPSWGLPGMSSWSGYNTSSSLTSWGFGSATTTSFSSYGSSSGYGSAYSSLGAGSSTGLPYTASSSSSSWTNTLSSFIPVYGAASQAYNDFS